MKKLLPVGALALSLILISEQQASAWSNFKFGIGMNIDWSCGNNNVFWGMFRGGDPGGPSPWGRHGHHGGHFGGGGFAAPCFSDAGGFGNFDQAFYTPAPFAAPMNTGHAAAPMTYPSYYNPYYTAGYNYYTMPAYYYPATWYGR